MDNARDARRVEGGAQRRKKADEETQTKCGGSDERGCPKAPVGWMAFPRAADRGCVIGLVLRLAAQTPYRIGRLSATLASHGIPSLANISDWMTRPDKAHLIPKSAKHIEMVLPPMHVFAGMLAF